MAKHRLCITPDLAIIREKSTISLDDATRHYTLNVLRLRDGTCIEIFDGQGNAYQAKLRVESKRSAKLLVESKQPNEPEPTLSIELIQTLARGEKMDWIIQKVVELGVTSIRPIISEHCNVKLNENRAISRFDHWTGIIKNACEQCGRNTLPTLHQITNLQELIANNDISGAQRWLFHPRASSSLRDQEIQEEKSISIVIGPEGGFSDKEIADLCANHFSSIKFGQRILRTETAAIASISAIQSRWGDI